MTNSYYTAINTLRSGQLSAMCAEASGSEVSENEDVSLSRAGSGSGAFDFQALLLESFAKGGVMAAERAKTSNADFTRYGSEVASYGSLNSQYLSDSIAKADARKAELDRRGTKNVIGFNERESYDTVYAQNQTAEHRAQSREECRQNEPAYNVYAAANDINGRKSDVGSGEDGNYYKNGWDYSEDSLASSADVGSESHAAATGNGASYESEAGTGRTGRTVADSRSDIAKLLASGGLSGDMDALQAYLESLSGDAGASGSLVASVTGDGLDGNAINANKALMLSLKEFLDGQAAASGSTDGESLTGVAAGGKTGALADDTAGITSSDEETALIHELQQKISEFLNSDIAVTDGRSDVKSILAELMAIAGNKVRDFALGSGSDSATHETADSETLLTGTTDPDGILSAGTEKPNEDGDSRGSAYAAAENGTLMNGAQAAVITNMTGMGSGASVGQTGAGTAAYAVSAVGTGVRAGGVKSDGLGCGIEQGVGTDTAESKLVSALTDSADASKNQRQPGDTGGRSNGQTAYNTDFSGAASHQTRESGNRAAASGFGRGGEAGAARGFETAIRPEFYSALSREAKLVLSGEKSEIVMNLTPETLGKMTMKVVTEQGVVSAKFVVENEAARQSLEENLTQLKDTLSAQGMNVESCMVEVRQDGGQAARYNESGGSQDTSGQDGGGQNSASGIALDDSNGIIDAGRRAFLRDRYFEQESSVRYTA